ncbi:MAG TPA: hypothetical protein VK918_10095, partial [Pyrinomonadaceae bacterium]|nr:hypothetical protein [Pyrinomonadaceae bacterium]
MKRLQRSFLAISMICMATAAAFSAPSVDQRLAAQINSNPLALTPVAITFVQKPASSEFLMMQSLGITGGYALTELPIVLTRVNRTQFNALKTKSGIRSLYGNATMKLLD